MKISLKKVFNVLKRLFVVALVLVLLVIMPSVKLSNDQNMGLIYEKFVGKRADYQGMIEIWNIDTFEGASVSKKNLLNKAATMYQSKNKGVYFMIRNMSESECNNLLALGQTPDLFSCSYGVSESIKDYIIPFDAEFNIYSNLLEAGRCDNEQYGLAWCANSYYLISTEKNLENAKQDKLSSLETIALDAGYEKINKKNTTTIYSLDFGMGNYLLPHLALSAYYDNGVLSISNNSMNKTILSQNAYSAYCNFVAGKSTMLLGAARDVIRVKNREASGKLQSVLIKPLEKFTDMVQFVFMTQSEDEVKQKYIQDFAKSLTLDSFQKQVLESGLCSVKQIANSGVTSDIIPQNIESYVIFNVFKPKTEIDELQKI